MLSVPDKGWYICDQRCKLCVNKSTDPLRWASIRADYRAAWWGGQGLVDFGKQVKARCPRFLFRQVFRCGCIDAAIHKELTDGFADGAGVNQSAWRRLRATLACIRSKDIASSSRREPCHTGLAYSSTGRT